VVTAGKSERSLSYPGLDGLYVYPPMYVYPPRLARSKPTQPRR
jgi:hypothetical protein